MSLLDWIDAMSLHDSDSSIRALPTERIVTILQGVASALGYIHGKGLLYRDVKTGNVLLSFSSDQRDLIVKLSDFGTTMCPPQRGSYPGYGSLRDNRNAQRSPIILANITRLASSFIYLQNVFCNSQERTRLLVFGPMFGALGV